MPGDIAIIGGGIGGLTAAIAMQRHGLSVRVYEAAAELREVGAGILVPPNAMRVLDRLGLGEAVREAGHPFGRVEVYDARAGLLQALDLGVRTGCNGYPGSAIHRSELQRILAAAVAPGTIELGRVLERFADAPPSRVEAYLRSAESPVRPEAADAPVRLDAASRGVDLAEAELLVGADGLHSTVRRQLFPDLVPRYSGQSSYRAVAESRLATDFAGVSREIWAAGCRFGYIAIGAGRVYWYATWDAPPGEEDAPGELAERLALLAATFPAPVPELVAATGEDQIVRTDLSDLRPLANWHDGRVVLLGDAAHASTPNLGQGGAQAMEDGYVLALALADSTGLRDALRHYEKLRRPRARRVATRSWWIGKAAHWRNPAARALRNLLLRSTPAAVARRQLGALYELGY